MGLGDGRCGLPTFLSAPPGGRWWRGNEGRRECGPQSCSLRPPCTEALESGISMLMTRGRAGLKEGAGLPGSQLSCGCETEQEENQKGGDLLPSSLPLSLSFPLPLKIRNGFCFYYTNYILSLENTESVVNLCSLALCPSPTGRLVNFYTALLPSGNFFTYISSLLPLLPVLLSCPLLNEASHYPS